jgi:hypothetical protein
LSYCTVCAEIDGVSTRHLDRREFQGNPAPQRAHRPPSRPGAGYVRRQTHLRGRISGFAMPRARNVSTPAPVRSIAVSRTASRSVRASINSLAPGVSSWFPNRPQRHSCLLCSFRAALSLQDLGFVYVSIGIAPFPLNLP